MTDKNKSTFYTVEVNPSAKYSFEQFEIREAVSRKPVELVDLLADHFQEGVTLCKIEVKVETLHHEPLESSQEPDLETVFSQSE